MRRIRIGHSRYFQQLNESSTSLLLRSCLKSPWLLLLIIVISFVLIGWRLIADINDNLEANASSKNTEQKSNNIEPTLYASNKPLRIILTTALNIEPQRVYLFLSSYRRWHLQSDERDNKIYQLYLFTKFSEEKYFIELQRLAEFFNVNIVDMDPIEEALNEKYSKLLDINMKYIKINKRRFFILFYWLNAFNNPNDIDAIFLSDGNDVKFQGNIFTLYDTTINENKMSLSFDDNIFWFFMENPDVKMDNEKWNRRYIKYCFGNDSIGLYHDLHVSCSGTSLATYKAMYYYLEIMNEILIKQGQLFYDCLRKPGDQAVHNIILHKQLLEEKDKNIKVVKIPNDSEWVLQITTMINHPYWSKKVPQLAQKSIVVHQWKWARTVKAQYEKEYNYATFCTQQGWDQCTVSKS